MKIVCKSWDDSGCGCEIVKPEYICGRSGPRGLELFLNPKCAWRVSSYKRLDAPKRDVGTMPYTLHCASCGAALGATIRQGKNLADCFSWRKTRLSLSGDKVLPCRKWDGFIDIIKQHVQIEIQKSVEEPPPNQCKVDLIPVNYCKVQSMRDETLCNLTAVEPQTYQKELIRESLRGNTLLCLPAGSGKTLVAAGVVHAMKLVNRKKIVIVVANSIPLVYQQGQALRAQLPKYLCVEELTGETAAAENSRVNQKLREHRVDVLVITSGKLQNSQLRYLGLAKACALILNEAHHVHGNNLYGKIMQAFHEIPDIAKPLLLALTTSPILNAQCNDSERAIKVLAGNLKAKISFPLTSFKDLTTHQLIPEARCILSGFSSQDAKLHENIMSYCKSVLGLLESVHPQLGSLTSLLEEDIWKLRLYLKDHRTKRAGKHGSHESAAIIRHLLEILHVLEVLEVMGSEAALKLLQKLIQSVEMPTTPLEKIRKAILSPLNSILHEFMDYRTIDSEPTGGWPVLIRLLNEIIEDDDHSRNCIVFVVTQRTAYRLQTMLASVEHLKRHLSPGVLTGSSLDSQSEWQEQHKVLKSFKNGDTRLLVATSILEDGLDIPSSNLVIRFNDHAPLRSLIQRQGGESSVDGSQHVTICRNEVDVEELKQRKMDERTLLEIVKSLARARHGKSSIPNSCSTRPVFVKNTKNTSNGTDLTDCPDSDIGSEMDDDLEVAPAMPEWGDDEVMAFVKAPVQPSVSKVPGLSGSVANIPLHYDIKILREWFRTIAPVRTFEPTSAQVEYSELSIVDFTLQSTEDPNDLAQNVMKHWIPSSMWLHLAPPRQKVRKSRVWCKRLKGGCWSTIQGQNNMFLSYYQIVKKDCFFHLDHVEFGAFFRYSSSEGDCLNAPPMGTKLPRQENFLEIRMSAWQLRKFVLVDSFTSNIFVTAYITLKHPPKLMNLEYSCHTDRKSRNRRNCLPGIQPETIGSSMVYAIDFDPSDMAVFLDFMAELRIRVWYTKVHIVPRSDKPHVDEICKDLGSFGLENQNVHDIEDLAYAWRCVMSAPCYQQKFTESILDLNLGHDRIEEYVRLLYALADELENTCFCTFSSLLQRAKKSRWVQSSTRTIHDGACWVKRVLVTPTRIVFCTPDLLQKSRVLRNYPPQAFMRVSFRDEGFTKIIGGSEEVSSLMMRISSILQEGLYVGKFHYQFLTSSSSQLRDHSVWFVRSDLLDGTNKNSAQVIRDWMGDFSGIDVIATLISRLGQSFSISIPTVNVSIQKWKEIPDVKNERYCFSDGIGKISSSLAEQVTETMGLAAMPSAFQIRFGGVKGVVAVDPIMTGQVQMCLRPSMIKFNSSHSSLEVLAVARPQPMYLNQQIIMVFSNIGTKDECFLELLQRHHKALLAMMTHNDKAYQMAKTLCNDLPWKLMEEAKVPITLEPFHRSLLVAFYRMQVKGMVEKARIRVDHDKGRVLLGVMDEEGLLEYGEVFIRISEDIFSSVGNARVIEGDVAIAKCPCLHPGDARVLKAVHKEGLMHHKDVIVFPRKGPRPHPDELSGSDLDGDLYHTTWDEQLIPNLPMHSAMDYTPPKKRKVEGLISATDMCQFVCEYIEKENLGVIDNMHKSLADSQRITSSSCLNLARLHSRAVDAPKTGKWARIPSNIREEHLAIGYPDFMMKTNRKSYVSPNILGKVFRESKKCMTAAEMAVTFEGDQDVMVDESFLVEGYEEYLDSSRQLRENYNLQLLGIMQSYGIGSEGELMSGCITQTHRNRSKAADVTECVVDLRRALVKSLQRKFEETLIDPWDPEARMKQASAWYYVTYHPDERTERHEFDSKSVPLLSFPWAVAEHLCTARRRNVAVAVQPKIRSYLDWLTQSTLEIFSAELDFLLETSTAHKNCLLEAQACVGSYGVLHLSSISALMLSKGQLDLSMLIIPNEGNSLIEKSEQVRALEQCQRLLRPLFNSTTLVTVWAETILELTNGSTLSSSGMEVDMIANPIELQQANLLQQYILEYPWILPALRLILKWGRGTGLIGQRKYSLLPTDALVLLCINSAIEEGYVEPIYGFSEDIDSLWLDFWSNISDMAEEFCSNSLGPFLVSFFSRHVCHANLELHYSLQKAVGCTNLSMAGVSEGWSILAEQIEIAGHALMLNGNAAVLLSKAITERAFFLTKEAAQRICRSVKQHMRWLKDISGAEVTTGDPQDTSRFGMVIRAFGSSGQIFRVDKAIQKLEEQDRRLKNMASGQKHPFFIRGSSLLVVEGTRNNSKDLVLEDYFGWRQPQHDNLGAYTIRKKAAGDSLEHKDITLSQFLDHLQNRVELVGQEFDPSLHGRIDLVTSFGRIYILEPPASFVEDTDGISMKQMNSSLALARRVSISPKLTLIRSNNSMFLNRMGPKTRTAFIAGKSNATIHDVEEVVQEFGFGDPVSDEAFRAIVAVASSRSQLKAVYNSDLEFQTLVKDNIRWMVTDVKRNWVEDESNAEGKECDVRIQLRTQKREDAALCDTSLLEGMLYWGDGDRECEDAHPSIRASADTQVLIIRHTKDKTFRYVGNLEGVSPLIQQVKIRVGTCHTHCRPDEEGNFTSLEKFVDVRVKLELAKCIDSIGCETLGKFIWDLSMKISNVLGR